MYRPNKTLLPARGGILEAIAQNCNHHPETSESTQQCVHYLTLKNDDNLEDDDDSRLEIQAEACSRRGKLQI